MDNESQSPSLRGSGRFEPTTSPVLETGASLNPLHCGAVVASGSGGAESRRTARWSQSPSLRGSGRFKGIEATKEVDIRESQSPSLRGSGRFAGAR